MSKAFFQKYKLLSTLLLMVVISVVLLAIIFGGLSLFTRHNHSIRVPKVKGIPFDKACHRLEDSDLRYEVIDSVYVEDVAPGTVLDVIPAEGSEIKPNRIVFLTVKAFYPQQMIIPNVSNVSERQARATLLSIGFSKISVKYVSGSHDNLAQAIQLTNGKEVAPGTRLFITTPLVLLVSKSLEGSGGEEEIVSDIAMEDPLIQGENPTTGTQPSSSQGELDDDESWW